MKQKASAAIAVIGPVLVITLLSAVTWQMYKFKELHFDMTVSYTHLDVYKRQKRWPNRFWS